VAYELQAFFRFPDVLAGQLMQTTLDECRLHGTVELAHPSAGSIWVAGDLYLNGRPTGISIEIHEGDESTNLAWQHAAAVADVPKWIAVTGLGILTLSGSVHGDLLNSIRSHWAEKQAALEFDEVDGFGNQLG
jgi:hypothetical protein